MGFKNYAVDVYGANSGSIKLPKQKYQYAVEFLTRGDFPIDMSGKRFDVSNITLPSTTYNTQTNNSYNRKVISILGKTYNPVTMSIYDDRAGNINKFLTKYDNHYFSSPPTDEGPHGRSTSFYRGTDLRNHSFISTHGENLKVAPFKDPILVLKIYNFSGYAPAGNSGASDTEGHGADVYTLYRPVITGFARDTLNYADSGLVQTNITFEYEYYDVEFVPGQ